MVSFRIKQLMKGKLTDSEKQR